MGKGCPGYEVSHVNSSARFVKKGRRSLLARQDSSGRRVTLLSSTRDNFSPWKQGLTEQNKSSLVPIRKLSCIILTK